MSFKSLKAFSFGEIWIASDKLCQKVHTKNVDSDYFLSLKQKLTVHNLDFRAISSEHGHIPDVVVGNQKQK